MKSRLSLLLCACLFAGCSGLIVTPKDQGKPASPVAPTVQSVSTADFFNTMADRVAAGHFDHTQRMVSVCTDSMKDLGVPVPANYDAVMEPYKAVNKVIDAPMRAKLVSDLRGLAK
jgi:hypothetical protein